MNKKFKEINWSNQKKEREKCCQLKWHKKLNK